MKLIHIQSHAPNPDTSPYRYAARQIVETRGNPFSDEKSAILIFKARAGFNRKPDQLLISIAHTGKYAFNSFVCHYLCQVEAK
jgi:hypothetical protein